RRRHTRWPRDWSSDVCSSDLEKGIEHCNSLRIIISGAEALTAEMLDRFHARTKALIANHYGPTEAAIDVIWWVCDRDGERRVVRSEERRVGREARGGWGEAGY